VLKDLYCFSLPGFRSAFAPELDVEVDSAMYSILRMSAWSSVESKRPDGWECLNNIGQVCALAFLDACERADAVGDIQERCPYKSIDGEVETRYSGQWCSYGLS